MRAELSNKNEYAIGKHRYYELKHFCMQYSSWKEALADISMYSEKSSFVDEYVCTTGDSDPTFALAILREQYKIKIAMVDKAISTLDPLIAPYIFKGVTDGMSYEGMNAKERIPCCREEYYKLYRKFFWELSRIHV